MGNHLNNTFVYGAFTSIFLRPLFWNALWRCILDNSFELGAWKLEKKKSLIFNLGIQFETLELPMCRFSILIITLFINKHVSIKELCKLNDIIWMLKVNVGSGIGLTLQTENTFNGNCYNNYKYVKKKRFQFQHM